MKTSISMLTLGVGLLLAAGCAQPGPAGPSPEQQAQAVLKEETHQCEPGKEEWRSPGPPKRGGMLFMSGGGGDHLDVTKPGASELFNQVYNGLMRGRACFPGDWLPALDLAKSWQSTDAQVWTFKLQENVRWQNLPPVNGRLFTSADVAWMVGLQKREGLLASFFQGVTYETPDPSTIVFTLPAPDADFLYKLADHRNVIMPREIYEQNGDFKTAMVGTGAFQLKQRTQAVGAVIEKNPNYWQKGLDGQPLPYLDGVRYAAFTSGDYAGIAAAYTSGQLDHTNWFPGTLGRAARATNPKLRLLPEIFASYHAVYFNYRRNTAYRDPQVRKAIAMAIDPEETMTAEDGGVYSTHVPAHLSEWIWPQQKIKEHWRHDPEQAKKLLAAAGYPTIKGTMKTAGFLQAGAESVQRQLTKVGIDLTMEVPPGSCIPLLQKMDWDITYCAYTGPNFINYWVGDFLRSDSNQNYMGVNDPELDALIKDQWGVLDNTTRRAKVDQLQEYLYETLPFISVMSPLRYSILTCRVKNAAIYPPSYNSPIALQAWLDDTGC